MSAFRATNDMFNRSANRAGTNATNGNNRTQATNELSVPPTKNCFIHFPVQDQSVIDDLAHKYPSRSCPQSPVLGHLDANDGGRNDLPFPAVLLEAAQHASSSSPTSPTQEGSHIRVEGTKAHGNGTEATPDADTFHITLELSNNIEHVNGRLGLNIDYSSGRELRITEIEQGGLMQEWNRTQANRGERVVAIGDLILSVNGIDTNPVRMLQECTGNNGNGGDAYVVDIRIRKTNPEASAACAKQGSAGHVQGICRPCAYLHKPSGCANSTNCTYCHECPEGELRRRKQVKMFFRNMMTRIQKREEEE